MKDQGNMALVKGTFLALHGIFAEWKKREGNVEEQKFHLTRILELTLELIGMASGVDEEAITIVDKLLADSKAICEFIRQGGAKEGKPSLN